MKTLKIRPKKTKAKRGFDPNAQKRDRHSWRHVAIELNREDISDGVDNSEVLELIEIHHLVIAPVESKLDKALIRAWCNQACPVYLSDPEFLAEMYVVSIDAHAVARGANVARIYHNSHLGDTRIHANSLDHVFPSERQLIPQVLTMVEKYVTVEKIADGDRVTWKNRLGD